MSLGISTPIPEGDETMKQAICEVCMQVFEKRSGNQKYCTDAHIAVREWIERRRKQMIKTFCNKCGKQLKYGDHRKVELTVRPYTTYGGRFNLDYCESCFKEIIGEEEYNAMIQKEIVHKRRIEERKKERNNDT